MIVLSIAAAMKNVNIAMLGSGFVAEFYLQGLQNVNGQQVVVNYSRTPERAKEFAGRWSILESTTSLDEVIARSDIDLYIIGLPNTEHLPAALKLAEARKNQVCTKPLARNREEAKQMLDAAQRAETLHGYAETEVFAPAVVKAREVIENGGVGRVLWVRSRESHSARTAPTSGTSISQAAELSTTLAATASRQRDTSSASRTGLSR